MLAGRFLLSCWKIFTDCNYRKREVSLGKNKDTHVGREENQGEMMGEVFIKDFDELLIRMSLGLKLQNVDSF